jgi:hypothetical protein
MAAVALGWTAVEAGVDMALDLGWTAALLLKVSETGSIDDLAEVEGRVDPVDAVGRARRLDTPPASAPKPLEVGAAEDIGAERAEEYPPALGSPAVLAEILVGRVVLSELADFAADVVGLKVVRTPSRVAGATSA